jgi:DNA repair ATPase RecN
MRPQNAKALMSRLGAVPDDEVVTPTQQRETLKDLTERACLDLDDIDALLEIYSQDPKKYEVRIEKLYRLKKDFYTELAHLWAIPSSIEATKKGISSISGDKVQVNLKNIDYRELDKAAAAAAKALDEDRLNDKHRRQD